MVKKSYKLVVIGAGVMGSAIVEAILHAKVWQARDITIVDLDRHKLTKLKRKLKIKIATDSAAAVNGKDFVLLAIKPQHAVSACADWTTKATVISILAGTTIAQVKKLTGSQKIVRVMPNTPAQIGAGISGWVATKAVQNKTLIRKLLSATGTEVELKTEKQINAVTAISGSGPAYFFAFVEALTTAGRKLGLGKNAATFAAQTFYGAAKLAENSNQDFQTLRENVTSKGGTTAAALTELKKQLLGKIVERATKAAYKRSQELSQTKSQ